MGDILKNIKKIIEAYKYPIYKGFIYPTIGFNSSFTSRDYEIEYTKYITFFDFMTIFHLKNKVKNPDFRYNIDTLRYYDPLSKGYIIELTSYVFDKNEHIDKFIVTNYDQIETYFAAHPGNVGQFCTMTFLSQSGNYIGDITDLIWLLRTGIEYPNIAEQEDKVCSIGAQVDPNTKEITGYFGWSHRAVCLFQIGDALFDSTVPVGNINVQYKKLKDYKNWDNIDKVPYKYRGRHACLTIDDCKKAAIAFADHVS